MSRHLDRRRLLTMSLAAAASGVLTGMTARSAESAELGLERELPPVPGMSGDRRANEMWFQFDDITLYHRIPEVEQAFLDMHAVFGDGFVTLVYDTWLELSASPGYSAEFAEFAAPIRAPLRVLSRVQLGVVDAFYRPRSPRLVDAFSFFGQGLLFDPRRAELGLEVHMMEGDPTLSYHLWHAFLRAMMVLDVDRARWAELDRLIGLAWALQSIAKPRAREINPPLPDETVRRLRGIWLPRTSVQTDLAFREWPYPAEHDSTTV
ncbi:hypothetical protein FHR81_001364 [Actinoalloteichus hoggarensis]|uniref:Uncharacterized protein n=1 Tax=Actinoalloteichus hoggarensis TaxID=1470176 RepID=A0A221W002_9PSEU|nr:hypothetical protein [Actinoalloteichus hoggarensis]ASO19097.1 hypothetical protein AHOG_07245 [Actinoalloteichus hoggarensis]MBB5920334.1 hypothetical protein [Actinoalloteichus hoggarensis]